MKNKLFVLGSVFVLTVLILGACARGQQASVEVSCDDFAEQQKIGQEVEVPVNGSLIVTLCSNPSTGFQWETAQIGDPSVLTEKSRMSVSPEGNQAAPRAGASGQEMWTFQALKAGTTTIAIAYSRPWEGGEKGVWIYDLAVTVK